MSNMKNLYTEATEAATTDQMTRIAKGLAASAVEAFDAAHKAELKGYTERYHHQNGKAIAYREAFTIMTAEFGLAWEPIWNEAYNEVMGEEDAA